MDEHHPVSMQGWTRVRRWLGRGKRVVVYGGEPGWRWEMDGPRKGFAPEMERLFGVQKGGTLIPGGRVVPAPPLDPLPQGMQRVEVSARRGVRTLQSVDGRPFVYVRKLARGSLAVYVACPLCELPVSCLAGLCAWLLGQVKGKHAVVETPLEVEASLFRNGGLRYLTARNHSSETRDVRYRVSLSRRPARITELLSGTEIHHFRFLEGQARFSDTFPAGSVRIYEIAM